MNTGDFLGYLLNILYRVFYLALSAVLLFFLIWIYVKLKRWYGRSRIARSNNDFKEVSDHIVSTGKKINFIQRFVLAQTGEILDIRSFIFYLICIFIGISLGLFGDDLLVLIFNEETRSIIYILFIVIFSLLYIIIWIFSLKSLIKYARFFPFIYCSAFLAIWILLIINIILSALS